jgi:hypothetical protein
MAFTQTLIKFGILDDVDVVRAAQRPHIVALSDDYFASGSGDMSGHALDAKGNYNIEQTKRRTPSDCLTLGFKIQTFGPGKFPIRFGIRTEEGDAFARERLFLNVVPATTPAKKVECQ